MPVHVAQLIAPHKDLPAAKHPCDSNGTSMSFCCETIEYITPVTDVTPTVPPVAQNGHGRACIRVMPGNLRACLHVLNASGFDSNGNIDIPSQDWERINSKALGILVPNDTTNKMHYRVNSAYIKLEYIGDSDRNGGDIVVQKFAGKEDDTSSTTWTLGEPTSPDSLLQCSKRIPAVAGVSVIPLPVKDKWKDFRDAYNDHTNAADNMDHYEHVQLWIIGATPEVQIGSVSAIGDVPYTVYDFPQWRFSLCQNIEVEFTPGSLLELASPSKAPSNSDAEDALSRLKDQLANSGADIGPSSYDPMAAIGQAFDKFLTKEQQQKLHKMAQDKAFEAMSGWIGKKFFTDPAPGYASLMDGGRRKVIRT
jgi:hypothetical protein